MPQTKVRKKKVGGSYRAVDNGDGTYDILDVPIFAEVPAGERRNEKAVGQEWMRDALRMNNNREGDGYLPPVHIHHHEEGVQPEYAGKLKLKEVRQMNYEGRSIWTIFADIVDIPADVFSKIEKGFVPYRSVEVHSWKSPEIDSLALMTTEVPFFRFPTTTVGEVIKAQELLMHRGRKSPAMYWKRTNKRETILFHFEGDAAMADDDKVKKPDLPDAGEKDKKMQEDEEEKKKLECTEEEKKKDKLADAPPAPPAAAPPAAAPVAPAAPAVDPMMQKVLQLLQSIAQNMGIGGAAPAAPAAPPNAAPVQELKANKENVMGDPNAELIKLKAKADATEAEVSKMRAEKDIDQLVGKSAKELADGGWHVSEETSTHLREAAELGEKSLTLYMDTFKAHKAKEPADDIELVESDLLDSKDAEALEKFTKDKSPSVIKFGHEAAKEYQRHKELTRSDMTLEEFIGARVNMAKDDKEINLQQVQRFGKEK